MAMAVVLAAGATDSVVAVPDSSPRPLSADSILAVAPVDSVVRDTLRAFAFDSTVVKGVRRRRLDAPVDRAVWSRASSMGLPGAVESLRETPGVAFSSDLSGQFSVMGMPVEGTAITWNGAEILWPWHFGGLFGALDDWATGRVVWHNPPGAPSPSRGGAWLETQGRAGGDTDQVHAAARLGFVAGGAATWGRRGDWGWQATARRTWLDWALDLARDRKWTDQRMTVLFQDATAQLAWTHGPWKATVGWFGSEDTLGIADPGDDDDLVELSWANLAVPVAVSWKGEEWDARAVGSWSRYRRRDSDLGSRDTLDEGRVELAVGRILSRGPRIQAGFKAEAWKSAHRLDDSWQTKDWIGDRRRLVLEPTLGLEWSASTWAAGAWAGLVHAEHDAAVLEGGFAGSRSAGLWDFGASVERKRVGLARLDQVVGQLEAASPAWILPPGSAPRTTRLQIEAGRREYDPGSELRTEVRGLAWGRLLEGQWNWTPVYDRVAWENRFPATRGDGWGVGTEWRGTLGWPRLEITGRQILSMDVLRDTGSGPQRAPSRWAPWDQRWRTEFRALFAWKGTTRPRHGDFFWQTEVVGKRSSGPPRERVAGRTYTRPAQDMDTTFLYGLPRSLEEVRTPYFRLDLTPLRIGREGRWSFWWTVVNLTNEKNLAGWVGGGSDEPVRAVSQIPFLPVVFGAQLEI